MIRNKFVEAFGEEQALAFERAAEMHLHAEDALFGDMRKLTNQGSDHFKWVLISAITYQCAEIKSYRREHGIKVPWDQLQAWLSLHGEIASYDGSTDPLSLIAGEYAKKKGEVGVVRYCDCGKIQMAFSSQFRKPPRNYDVAKMSLKEIKNL